MTYLLGWLIATLPARGFKGFWAAGKKERIEKLEAENLEAEALSRRSKGEADMDPAEAESTHRHQSECTDKASGKIDKIRMDACHSRDN